MKKGRAQGGGPKKRDPSRRKKPPLNRRVEAARVERLVKAEKRRPRPHRAISAKRQWDRYVALRSDGASFCEVFARPIAADGGAPSAWKPVGHVAFGAAADAMSATALHKRLILEHSLRLHPELVRHRAELECGVVVSADAEPSLLEGTELAEPSACGFMGTPDESSGYYVETPSGAAVINGQSEETRKVILGRMGTDSKSATAMQFSESLGLRGH